jgi:hypothetical protein
MHFDVGPTNIKAEKANHALGEKEVLNAQKLNR